MNRFRLKGCTKCQGDLVLDDGDWLCLQCGTYYYTGLYPASGLVLWSRSQVKPPHLEKALRIDRFPAGEPAEKNATSYSLRQSNLPPADNLNVTKVLWFDAYNPMGLQR